MIDGNIAQAGSAIDVQMAGATRRFGDFVAVRDLDLTVPAGNILGVIGPSGAGKTTCLRLLTGALLPTQGTVQILGENPAHLSRKARGRIGYMPQLLTLLPDLTAGENIDFAASLAGMLWRRRRRRVAEVLELVELSGVRGRLARELSGGMQRRVELAAVLVHEPHLLFLDEPTAGIDPLLRERIWAELHRLRDAGRTILVTTQYVSEAELCDWVALIAEGRLVALGRPADLRRAANGGDVIEIEAATACDGRTLQEVPGVLRVRQLGPRSLEVVVDDAGAVTPRIVSAMQAAGSEITSSRELHQTFDQVFTALIEQTSSEPGAAPQ